MQHPRWRPSPGTVFGLLALVIAVAGTAMAGPLATTSVLNKKERKQVRKIARLQANKQISRRASDFTPAGEVHSPGRVVLNDPVPGDANPGISNLFTVGAFTVSAQCFENFAGGTGELARIVVTGPSDSSFSGTWTDGDNHNDVSGTGARAVDAFSSGNEVRSSRLTVVAPNQVLSVSASAEVGDPAGDCVFGVTAIGP